MAYIGRQLVRGQNRIYDDISSSFNGSTTAFNLNIGGSATPPAQVNQLWIVLGGILQKPGTDFTVADAQVTFTTAPASGLDFWAMIQGDTSDMNAPSDGSVTPTKIATSGDFAFPADVRFKDADGSHYVGLQAPTTVSSNLVWTLPAADGSANQILKTNGSGVLGWATDSATDSTKMPLAGGTFTGDVTFTGDSSNGLWDKSANAFVANLTGTASGNAVLTGSTDNTICTVTGAHAITGEANLTYDGSHLSIATDAHGEGLKITASGDTYNGITFDANRSGADTYMGALEAKWNGSLVSFISFETGADTTNKDDGLIAFSTRASGSSIAERMRVDSAGRILIGGTTSSRDEAKLQVFGTADSNYIAMQNTSASDGDGNRYGKLIYRGTQSGGEVTDLVHLVAAHEGTADDQKGMFIVKCNDGSDGTSPTEAFRVHNNGDITVASGSIKLSEAGQGINFHAHGSGVDSNVLDDYEEGTWTPTITTASGTITVGNVYQNEYTKIGRMVYLTARFTISAVSSPGGWLRIHTLPFTANTFGALAITTTGLGDTDDKIPQGLVEYNTTYGMLRTFRDGIESDNISGYFQNGTAIIMSVCYNVS